MKTIFLILSLLSLVACSTVTKKFIYTKKYESPKLHNADCLIEKQRFSESNLMLLEESETTYKMKAGDGKILGLPIKQCILSQIPLEESFSSETPKQKWIKCTLGTMSLVTDSLIYLDDEKHFYRLKRKDGQIWLLPREYCAIFTFSK